MINLKFRLTSGEIFEWRDYRGYLDLIENLDPENDAIIEIMEPFLMIDFEMSYLQYKRYMDFKDALDDIRTKRKFRTNEEMKYLTYYYLDSKLLKWLAIVRETPEEKEIIAEMRERDLYYRMDIYKIKYDSVVLYYQSGVSKDGLFVAACRNGHIKTAKWLLTFENDIYDLEIGFFMACFYNHINIAKWIYNVNLTSKMFSLTTIRKMMIEYTKGKNYNELLDWLESLD